MATGASTAALAIIMIDARKEILDQTRRHAFIAALLGIGMLFWPSTRWTLSMSSDRFEEILADFTVLNDRLGFADITSIPVSALYGDNIIARSIGCPGMMAPPESS